MAFTVRTRAKEAPTDDLSDTSDTAGEKNETVDPGQ
jgi:hypothetical protein